jgi:hypothetical protein
MIVVLLVYNALTAFTSYDLVYAMTGGGPGTATTLLSFQIWRESFSMYGFGAGSAVALIVVTISAVMMMRLAGGVIFFRLRLLIEDRRIFTAMKVSVGLGEKMPCEHFSRVAKEKRERGRGLLGLPPVRLQ